MAIKSATYDSEFTVFSRFSQAFSHVVRGDLSVITNELSYLATRYPTEDLSRVRNRCAQMAATISKIAGLESSARLTQSSTTDIARIFSAIVSTLDDARVLQLDMVKVERFASIVRAMLGGASTEWRAHGGSGSHNESFALSFSCSRVGGAERVYSSWSEFASKLLGERSVIDAVVADLIMRAHGWSVSIETRSGGVTGQILIPLSDCEYSALQCA